MLLAAGTPAPEFSVPDDGGVIVSLADLRGGWVLLWWYPRADTPG
jgi:peroxiredoxin Q/BCP